MVINNWRQSDLMRARLYSVDFKDLKVGGGIKIEFHEKDGTVHVFYIPKSELPLKFGSTWARWPLGDTTK